MGPTGPTGPSGPSLKIKAGVIPAANFSGDPKKNTVTFSTPFADANYAVTTSGVDKRTWSYESKTASGFILNTNANSALTNEVSWHAIAVGETN